ncbi:hypothetical protein QP166_11140 [Sphingomonas sp. LR60]|uniref:hypothetical protein n=1 Tax=Sphingomonas sp. LR60 TaxID=3050233 RepID=UPI002FE30740
MFGLFFSGGILVVGFTLVRSLYLREMLGEDIPRSRERTLFTAMGTPREVTIDKQSEKGNTQFKCQLTFLLQMQFGKRTRQA